MLFLGCGVRMIRDRVTFWPLDPILEDLMLNFLVEGKGGSGSCLRMLVVLYNPSFGHIRDERGPGYV